ncbi:MAG: DUF5667 domain-containing protein [Patescibacteria group bacterium]
MKSNNRDPRGMFENSKDINLTKSEKQEGRDILARFIDANPVEKSEHSHNRASIFKNLFNVFLKPMPAFFALLLLVTGGTSLAAEYSVPGDLLYPVKIHVNEEVRSALAFSEESKAYIALDRAEERLEEAEVLAVKGKLTPEVRIDLEVRFTRHLEQAQKRAATAKINSDIKAKLYVHEETLTKISNTQQEPVKVEIDALNTRIRGQLRDSKKSDAPVNSETHNSRRNSDKVDDLESVVRLKSRADVKIEIKKRDHTDSEEEVEEKEETEAVDQEVHGESVEESRRDPVPLALPETILNEPVQTILPVRTIIPVETLLLPTRILLPTRTILPTRTLLPVRGL